MRALDIEDNIEHLRYDKMILATEANVNLVVTRRIRDLRGIALARQAQ